MSDLVDGGRAAKYMVTAYACYKRVAFSKSTKTLDKILARKCKTGRAYILVAVAGGYAAYEQLPTARAQSFYEFTAREWAAGARPYYWHA